MDLLRGCLVFLSLILSGFSQEWILNSCRPTTQVQTAEYTCDATGTGSSLQWIVEPVAVADTNDPNSVRFLTGSDIDDVRVVGNIIATFVSSTPFVSRLTIRGDPTLNQTDVVCKTASGNITRAYVRNNYEPLPTESPTISSHTRTEDFATLSFTPSTSTDVDYYSITNSQNNESVFVKPPQSSVTIPVTQERVDFTITTTYLCGYTSGSETYSVDAQPQSTTTSAPFATGISIGFLIWAIIATVIAVVAILVIVIFLIVLILKLKRINELLGIIEGKGGIEFDEKIPK